MKAIAQKFTISLLLGLMTCVSSFAGERIDADIVRQSTVPVERGSGEIIHLTHEAVAQESQYHSGDTAYYLCLEDAFQFGTISGTDTWGYRAPDGTEYAIFGIYNGVAVINTSNMTVVGTVVGPENSCGTSRWRDMKSYRNFVYVTSECTGTNQGVMILNMTNLPASFSYVGSVMAIPTNYPYSHNLSIDTAKGYMYVEAAASPGLTLSIYNLTNPASPTFVASMGINYGDNGIHDMWAWNDTLILSEGSNHTFSIWNMANKNSPALIQRVTIPAGGYVHNAWPSADMHYLATTEETAGKTVKIWDIQDFGNIQLIGQYLGSNGLAHNVHWKGDRLYISHYEAGVTVVDVSDPSNPTELFDYDTYSGNDPDFNGCWGAYPFTGNGLVYASNMDGKMYIFKEHVSVLSDTMWAATTIVAPGSQAIVDIYATNSLPIHQFTIPLDWTGPYSMALTALDRTGTRTEYFESESYLGLDIANNRIAVELRASNAGTSPDLPPGTGKILSLIFDVPEGASGQINPVTFAPYVYGGGQHNPTFTSECLGYQPDTISGGVELNTGGCCVGVRGDANGNGTLNVVDLNYLVAYFFLGGAPPSCFDEADANGNGTLNVVDLNYLVAYFFLGGTAPADCP